MSDERAVHPPLDATIGHLRVRCFAALDRFTAGKWSVRPGDLLMEDVDEGDAIVVRDGERDELAGVVARPANIDDTPTLAPQRLVSLRCLVCGSVFEGPPYRYTPCPRCGPEDGDPREATP